MGRYTVAVLPGDGIGPEVMTVAQAVLDRASALTGVELDYRDYEAGAGYYRRTGVGITDKTMRAIGEADAILFGAMGLPDVRRPNGTEIAPQLDIREHYHLFASLRPARMLAGVPPTVYATDIDMVVIRELTEGLFAGRNDPPSTEPDRESDRMTITRATSELLFEVAFEQAAARNRAGRPGHVTLLDKANVLKSSAFMRSIFDEVAARHPEVATDRLYIDAAAMLMVVNPGRFDVVVTENLFGDIISEVAAGIAGGLGLAASAEVGIDHAVFQPAHGSAPDIAGKGIANPIGMVLSAAMMLDWLGQRHQDAGAIAAGRLIDDAVAATLAAGVGTPDIGGAAGTSEVGDAIIAAIARQSDRVGAG